MSKIVLSRNMHEKLMQHRVETERNLEKILTDYFSKNLDKREFFRGFLCDYIKQLDTILKKVCIIETLEDTTTCLGIQEKVNQFPFVIINSVSELFDLDNKQNFKYRLTHPYQDPSDDIYCISYLSPLGGKLMLKKVNESFQVNTPAGICNFKVLSISLS